MEAIRHLPEAWPLGDDPLDPLTDEQVLEALEDWRHMVRVPMGAVMISLGICFLNQLERRYVCR